MQLTKDELVHLISRFDRPHVRTNNCILLHKDVVNLREKLIEEYYSRTFLIAEIIISRIINQKNTNQELY